MCLKELNMMDNKAKLTNIIIFMTLGVAFSIIVTVSYWLIHPYRPMTIGTRPLPVINKEVKQGSILYYSLDYCKTMELPVTVRRRFVDGLIYSLPDISANNAVGCREQIIGMEIPQNLPTGDYVLAITYSYQVNPIRKVEVGTHTEKFVITE